VLWPTEDPLFPIAWSDRIDAFLAEAQLHALDAVGHFVPLQAPGDVAAAIRAATGTSA
jgi:pimeloyl-ACP methyl ester carboxylesterase